MARIRLYDLASRFGKTPEQIREILTSNGVKLGASPSASVDEAVANKILSEKKASRPRRIAVRRRRKAEAEPEPVVEEAVAEEVEAAPEVADVVEADDTEPVAAAEQEAIESEEAVAEVAAVEASDSEETTAAEPADADPEAASEEAPAPVAADATEEPATDTEEKEAPASPGVKVAPPASEVQKKPAAVAPVARVVRVIDADAIRQRLKAEGRRGFGRKPSGGAPAARRGPAGGSGPGRPNQAPGRMGTGGLGGGAGGFVRPPMPGPAPGGPGGRRGRAAQKKRRKRRLSKEALLEMQGEELLRRTAARRTVDRDPSQIAAHKRVLSISETVSIQDLAHMMSVKAAEVVGALFQQGVMVTMTQSIDFETATLIAEEFGFEVKTAEVSDTELLEMVEDSAEDLKPRPPVVTVMGHVDHGKTSLLDRIRAADVVSGEAGGITQHIGAYQVQTPAGPVTFLDTPGHAAFSAMRARGSEVTDLVILVVAADDGIKPQTVEAIKHAQEAEVPIVVALNKMDRPEVKPDQILQELTEFQIVPEEWGGDTMVAKVSAKTGEGVEEMLEGLALQAEMLELRANPDKPAIGSVVEAKLDRGRGSVTTVLVHEGTLRKGDTVVAGSFFGRVRALTDERGRIVAEAGPSCPVAVQGLSGVPMAGDSVYVAPDEKTAKQIAERRSTRRREAELARGARVNLESFLKHGDQAANAKQLNVVIKGDVQGSVEALKESLNELSVPAVKVNVVHSGVGAITANDVSLAVAAEAVVIGFNIRPDTKGAEAAAESKVDVRIYKVIYEVIDDIRAGLEGLLAPTQKEVYLGRAEVKETFRAPKLGTVAGCIVVSGMLRRSAKVRLLRNHKEIYVGELSSLRRFKDDVEEVPESLECGMGLEGWSDLQNGDLVECYDMEEVQVTLEQAREAAEAKELEQALEAEEKAAQDAETGNEVEA
ncbi:MAG: translation initiation factor IF-2 [Myxococcota bacterium]|nr:translation initiation factor IF-2 [Myxococcota bacterium]